MRRMTLVALLPLAAVACSDDVSGPNGNNGPPGVPSVGDILTLNVPRDVDDPCDASPDARDGRVVEVTANTVVVVDTANPSGDLSDQQYSALADEFEEWGYPVVVDYFGEPSDLDENERVIAFFTRAVNQYTEEDDEGFIFGLFWPGDLFSSTGTGNCATSNEAEILYLAVPDPDGLAGEEIAADIIRGSAVGTMGHEMQHLVNASRRIYFPPTSNQFEVIWLNEGLSHITEELMFFERTGSGPGGNIDVEWLRDEQLRLDAFNQFQVQNFIRFAIFLEEPETDTASLVNAEGTLASRGSDWHFLRYAADRLGSAVQADFWSDLVNTELNGLPNLTQALGTAPEPWIRDWSAAVYADDEVSGDAVFQFPSWNLREIYPAFEDANGNQIYPEYPLALSELTDDAPLELDIGGLSAAYVQVEVPPTGTATVTLSAGEAALEELRVSVVDASTAEVTQHEGDGAAEISLEGGTTGTTYVLAVLNASTTATSMLPLQLESDGAGPPLVASAASRERASASRGPLALGAALATSGAAVPLRAVNHRFHLDFLERAQRQLTPRIAHARRAYRERAWSRDVIR